MLAGLTAIMLFEVAGDYLQALVGLPIPGPVIGMALMLFALIARGGLPGQLDRAAGGILFYLPMLFVPAGAGVMAHFDLIKMQWPALVIGIVGSSVLAISVTALTMRGVERAGEVVRALRRRVASGAMESAR